ncbi:hypothetical protein ACFYUD_31930 [Nocardia tengchongensis]|uniref:hypothetical protein n=1 Tax=Nocardia tengchongensis TaxID=2055889 RepID=UPI0036920BE6
MTSPWTRCAKTAATVSAGAAALLLATAPDAAAAGLGPVTMEGSKPLAGCTYKVTSGDLVGGGSSAYNEMPVTFFDNGTLIGTAKIGTTVLVGNPAKVSWTPATPGPHTLTATLGFDTPQTLALDPVTVQVGPSAATGSFGCPIPSISG